jgi:UDP-N-acetylglucosamine--N-acetylmuramyl-(pentapeptide) pyrophosphoryl-undecaprenol N-acetylglucosamine transferase
MKNLKVIISGGGTGGHIFPAIAIAKAIENKSTKCRVSFCRCRG